MAATSSHILVIPYPAQGHMTPILDLTAQLVLKGLTRITILVTPNNLQTLTPLLATHPSIETLVLPFPSHPHIPPGVESITQLGNASNPAMMTTLSALQQPVTEWFKIHPSPPTAVISDWFLGSWTQNLALHLGIPRLAFYSSGAFFACVVSHLFTDMDDDVDEGHPVQFMNLPQSPCLECGELPSNYRLFKAKSSSSNPYNMVFKNTMLANLSSWGCIFNAFHYMEGEYLDHMAKNLMQNRPVFGVGPLNLLGTDLSTQPPMVTISSAKDDDHNNSLVLFNWLESCPDESVLYISFGSQKWLTQPQSQSLALALENSSTRFIWVARSGPGGQSPIPDGFEDRVGDRGFVSKSGWVSQVKILNHKAVGQFLTHCGWNSILEGLRAGVMILCWPMEGDQFVNAKFLVDQLGVAVRVCEAADNAVPEVDKLVRLVKEEGDDGDRRRRVGEMKGKIMQAVGEAGSSVKDLDQLVKQLIEME